MKVKKIEVVNLKAVEEQALDLNGASVIVTGGNDKGKSTLLKSLIDRFQGEKPGVIVKHGEEKGFSKMELTDGSIIEWNFTDKSERLSFTTPDDLKITSGVISTIGHKYFGVKFDINKFIRSSKSESLKMVQKLIGIDFSEIDERYKNAYNERSYLNKELKRIIGLDIKKPEPVENPDIESIKKEKERLLSENQEMKKTWLKDNEKHQEELMNFNKIQNKKKERRQKYLNDWNILEQFEDEDAHEITKFIDFERISRFYDKMEKPEELKEISSLVEPYYHDITDIDEKLEQAYSEREAYTNYQSKLKKYEDWVKEGATARKKSDEADATVKSIEEEKREMIRNSNLPKEFEIKEDALYFRGMLVDDNQLSSSSKYICALKLGSLGLGKIRTMHFDCSFLDKNSLKEIQDWAESEDLQLLIEKPEWNGGEIKYEILDKS